MLKFFKMHGIGNDYIFVDSINKIYNYNFSNIAKLLSKRHYFIGSDGLIVLKKSKIADVKMCVYNSDGSKASFCGNATRCVCFYMFKKIGKKEISVESKGNVYLCKLLSQKNNVATVAVLLQKCKFLNVFKLEIGGKNVTCNIVDVGNKHCIIFVDSNKVDFYGIYKKINSLKAYKNGINVEFVKILSRDKIQVVVLERGSLRTLACGSGASASCYAGFLLDKLNDKVNVLLDGGNLRIKILSNNKIIMLGKCNFVYKGEIDWL